MPYAQINYPQELGDGPVTIAESGCFVTAFSNLLERFGNPVDPPTLNQYFLSHNDYLPETENGRTFHDLLAWGSVASYDGRVTIAGSGTGWPDSNDAIVKFVYKSKRTGATVVHFSLVSDCNARTIVDSWDGVTKVSPYGTPVQWYKYEYHNPQAIPAPAPATTPSFTVEPIAPIQKMLKIDAKLWDMNRRTWPEIVNNPVGGAAAGSIFTAAAKAHHMLGGTYYMTDPGSSQGYNVVDCQDAPQQAPVSTPAPSDSDIVVITVMPGWGITHVLQAAGYNVAQFSREEEWDRVAALNGSSTRLKLTPGQQVKVYRNPLPLPTEPEQPKVYTTNTVDGIVYEAYDQPRRLWISKKGGAEKWSFADVKDWRDFKSVQHVDYGTEVYIVGVAHHPIPPVGADYYMVDADFADFKKTGNVKNLYGFNHADLSDTKPAPEEQVAAPVPEPTPVVEVPAEPVVPEPTENPNAWQDTYQKFLNPVHYISTRDYEVQELSGQAKPLMLKKYDGITDTTTGVISIYGTVKKDGVDYYRAKINTDKDFNLWYCIPKLDPETKTPILLVMPTNKLEPITKGQLVRDSLQLTKEHLEKDAMTFFDDMVPKWLRKKK